MARSGRQARVQPSAGREPPRRPRATSALPRRLRARDLPLVRAPGLLFAILLIPLVLAAVAPAGAATVAVLLSSDADEYREALKGFKEASGHQVVAVYDMEADPDQGKKLLNEIERKVKPDLLFAVGTWALQAV